MIAIETFDPRHLEEIRVQDGQPEFDADQWHRASLIADAGRAWTARDGAGGPVLMIGGVVESHPDYATMWALMSAQAGPHMRALTRRVRWMMAKLPHARLDALCREQFAAGHRWLRLLGFEREGRMAAYFEDGEAAMVYRRIG